MTSTTTTTYKYTVQHVVAGQIFTTTGYVQTEELFLEMLNIESDNVVAISCTEVAGR